MNPLPPQCPYSMSVIEQVAQELRNREMFIKPVLLSGDAGVLLDRLTERNLDKLVPAGFMVRYGKPDQTWVRWIAWHEFHAGSQKLNRMHHGPASIALGEVLYLLGRWLMSNTADPMTMGSYGNSLPSGLWYIILACGGDSSAFYNTNAWPSWRLYPIVAEMLTDAPT